MTQEEKELLFKDLSARLRFGVKICCAANHKINGDLVGIVGENAVMFSSGRTDFPISVIRPYLRPMSSMTEEELNEGMGLSRTIHIPHVRNWFKFAITNPAFTDWLNAHHFDHRGLIEKGLALEAPEGMYK